MKEGVNFINSESDLRACYQLRYKVYVEGMGRFFDKANHKLKELKDELDDNARAVLAVKNKSPIGTLRLFWGGDMPFTQKQFEAYHLSTFKPLLKQDKICIVERLMVDDKFRGTTTVLRMYKEVLDFIVKQKVEVILLDCEPHHLESYLKLGFRPFAKQYNYAGVGTVIPMALIVGDYQHLQRVGSPFSTLFSEDSLSYCQYGDILKNKIFINLEGDSKLSFNRGRVTNDVYTARNKLLTKRPSLFSSRLESKLCAC